MSKYNQTKVTPTVTNHQGGESIKLKPELELISILATGLDGQFYEKESEKEKRVFDLCLEVAKKNPVLLAKMLVYARSVIGQRSVTHVGAVAAAKYLSGHPIASKLFTKRHRKENKGGVIYRLDDMMEIMAYYFMRNTSKSLPNSIKKGFKQVLENSDAYELAKFQGKTKSVSLVDIVNLVHPKPNEKMQETFRKLMNGELKQFNTAEDKQTKAGQVVAEKVIKGEITKEEAKVELKEAKAENWADLIKSGTLGYLALLRNLKNITEQASEEVFKLALEMLTDEKRVRKSLVFPHQIDLAFEVLLEESNIQQIKKVELLKAIDKAYNLAIPNLTELFSTGKTAVVVDTSGSMTSYKTRIGSSTLKNAAIDKASLIAATFLKGIGADLYTFDTRCRQETYNPLDSINTIKNNIIKKANGGGTYFNYIFSTLKEKYDRIFVISDMQGADSLIKNSEYREYKSKYGQPYIYSIDLAGYGTSMFKQNDKLINLYGYSKDIYEMVKSCEINPNAILKEIEKIEI